MDLLVEHGQAIVYGAAFLICGGLSFAGAVKGYRRSVDPGPIAFGQIKADAAPILWPHSAIVSDMGPSSRAFRCDGCGAPGQVGVCSYCGGRHDAPSVWAGILTVDEVRRF